MKIVANIWDRVLVVDDLVDLNIIDEYATYLEGLGDFLLSRIVTEEGITYDSGSGVMQSEIDKTEGNVFIETLFNSGMIPVIPNHKIKYNNRLHKMVVGSMMNLHTDHGYSLAVTTYVTDCVGGELVVEHPETRELSKIEPKRGRTVILKCETPHSVLEVTEGERISIQTFITYIKGDSNE